MINKMNEVDEWSEEQLEQIYFAAVSNGQIYSIINDLDVALFFNALLKKYTIENENTIKIKELLNKE